MAAITSSISFLYFSGRAPPLFGDDGQDVFKDFKALEPDVGAICPPVASLAPEISATAKFLVNATSPT